MLILVTFFFFPYAYYHLGEAEISTFTALFHQINSRLAVTEAETELFD